MSKKFIIGIGLVIGGMIAIFVILLSLNNEPTKSYMLFVPIPFMFVGMFITSRAQKESNARAREILKEENEMLDGLLFDFFENEEDIRRLSEDEKDIH